GALGAGQIAHHVHPVADLHRGPAQLPGPHGHHDPVRIAAERAPPSAPVLRDHHRLVGVVVVGADLGARPRPPASGADPDVGLVPVALEAAPPRPGQESAPIIAAHIAGKSGMGLPVVSMFSTSTPGTLSPMIAPAVAIRWSA